ncbi:MAG: NADH-ubiquinone oxidoreductase-F iron-sulfur binding region domain-containing protein [Planctomycetota bacterium]
MNYSNDVKDPLGLIYDEGGLKPGVARKVSAAIGGAEAAAYGAGSFYHLLARPHVRLRVCTGIPCALKGSEALLQRAKAAGIEAEACSCLAACDKPPAVLRDRELLASVAVADFERAGSDLDQLASAAEPDPDAFGAVGPEAADPDMLAIHLEGEPSYEGEALALARTLDPDEIASRLVESGLQGRGGAGFPAGRKWQSLLTQTEKKRYVVLNADEGEPHTFKDREVMIRRPDLVIEGLAIAAHTIGAKEVYLYLRGEFGAPRRALLKALERFSESGVLKDVAFHFHAGHGAYICGEETALLEALEGRRGMPRLKPPYPTEKGLFQKPTLVHNVETIACVPAILKRGADWFRGLGRTQAGTKLYSVSGHVKRAGVYEMPLGVSLDDLIDAAGGMVGTLKAFSPGGASSGFLPPSERTRPLDFSSLQEVGSMLGSGGVLVLNETVDLKDAVQNLLLFFERESCGQCAPCRIGTRYLRVAHERGCEHERAGQGEAKHQALSMVDDVAWEMQEGSICGLGQAAPTPLLTCFRYFPEELSR